MTVAILVLVVALAAANGSNDVPKGVATLAGAGITRYRTAISWGTVTTMAGPGNPRGSPGESARP